jgi:hypothetical protein
MAPTPRSSLVRKSIYPAVTMSISTITLPAAADLAFCFGSLGRPAESINSSYRTMINISEKSRVLAIVHISELCLRWRIPAPTNGQTVRSSWQAGPQDYLKS